MPSKALIKFERILLTDVHRILDSHDALNHDGGGRRGLGHLTRSGVFLLCAAWERYTEDLAAEIADKLLDWATSPEKLPKDVRKEVSRYVKAHKDELKPLELAGDGWKAVHRAHVETLCAALNTPKQNPIVDLFRRTTGWSVSFSDFECETKFIDEFVSVRGDIAHNGSAAAYVNRYSLERYLDNVQVVVCEMDNSACEYLKSHMGRSPWRRRN